MTLRNRTQISIGTQREGIFGWSPLVLLHHEVSRIRNLPQWYQKEGTLLS